MLTVSLEKFTRQKYKLLLIPPTLAFIIMHPIPETGPIWFQCYIDGHLVWKWIGSYISQYLIYDYYWIERYRIDFYCLCVIMYVCVFSMISYHSVRDRFSISIHKYLRIFFFCLKLNGIYLLLLLCTQRNILGTPHLMCWDCKWKVSKNENANFDLIAVRKQFFEIFHIYSQRFDCGVAVGLEREWKRWAFAVSLTLKS